MSDLTIVTGYVGFVQGLNQAGDSSVLNFSLASSNYAGKKGYETTWYSVEYWGKAAEGVARYVQKGAMLRVDGRIVPDEKGNPPIYIDKEGNPRASFRLRANSVERLGKQDHVEPEVEDFTDEDEEDMPF